MALIIITIVLFISSLSWFPAVESQSYLELSELQELNPLNNKRNVKNWLQEYVQKPQDSETGLNDNNYNIMTETNCKEVSIDLHIGGSVNHHPGVVEHRYCVNIRNSAQDICLHRHLKCVQHLEPIYIQDKENCNISPYQHYRPAGCKCSLNF